MRQLSEFGTTDVNKALTAKQKRKFKSIVDTMKEKNPLNDTFTSMKILEEFEEKR